MKRVAGWTVVAVGVALAVTIGQRMSTEAMAVAVGVVFGVAASIPASLLVVAASRGRRDAERARGPEYQPAPPQPQIYIVAPGVAGGQPAPWQGNGLSQGAPALWPGQGQWPAGASGYLPGQPARRYRVVGEDERWLDAEPWN